MRVSNYFLHFIQIWNIVGCKASELMRRSNCSDTLVFQNILFILLLISSLHQECIRARLCYYYTFLTTLIYHDQYSSPENWHHKQNNSYVDISYVNGLFDCWNILGLPQSNILPNLYIKSLTLFSKKILTVIWGGFLRVRNTEISLISRRKSEKWYSWLSFSNTFHVKLLFISN